VIDLDYSPPEGAHFVAVSRTMPRYTTLVASDLSAMRGGIMCYRVKLVPPRIHAHEPMSIKLSAKSVACWC
jgi:hypothetical protein